ncbi:uncharacterized protein [Watersipora subatra]|uniref:uncharacterized protein n=1 Tax=Watersipora subatra TaxID=2589382 RepID=UPI00355B286D
MSNTADRIGIMERRRALEMAKNMLSSKVGKVVLDENKFPDRTLELQVKRIDVESKKNASLVDNDKKMFKRARLINNLEPTILIERPAESAKEEPEEAKPAYMLATKKPKRIAIGKMPPTIDAFTVIKRKTKNLWETEYTEEDMTRKFRSIIMKSPPLTRKENEKLVKGHAVYRPASRNDEEEQLRKEGKRRDKIQMLQEMQRSSSPDAQLAFITQLEDSKSRRSESIADSAHKDIINEVATEARELELHFNPFHIERFEKIRTKQKKKFYSQMKV